MMRLAHCADPVPGRTGRNRGPEASTARRRCAAGIPNRGSLKAAITQSRPAEPVHNDQPGTLATVGVGWS